MGLIQPKGNKNSSLKVQVGLIYCSNLFSRQHRLGRFCARLEISLKKPRWRSWTSLRAHSLQRAASIAALACRRLAAGSFNYFQSQDCRFVSGLFKVLEETVNIPTKRKITSWPYTCEVNRSRDSGITKCRRCSKVSVKARDAICV